MLDIFETLEQSALEFSCGYMRRQICQTANVGEYAADWRNARNPQAEIECAPTLPDFETE